MSAASLGAAELLALSPLLALAAAAVAALLATAAPRAHGAPGPACGVALAGLAASLALLVPAGRQAPLAVTALLIVDRVSLYYVGLGTAATLVVALLSWGYLAGRGGARRGTAPASDAGEFFVLLLTAALGAGVLASSVHYVSLFLGLEVLSVSLYGLVAWLREGERGVEAGLKYLVLAGVSSAFLLFGTALLYAATGTLAFSPLRSGDPLSLAGAALFLVGAGFKLAAVPFHLWAPDVYQGAPLPVSAFLATVSKGAVLALLLRWTAVTGLSVQPAPALALALICAASMFAGNLLALFQDNLKRLLAYSSIAHVGYLLVGVVASAGGTDGDGRAGRRWPSTWPPTSSPRWRRSACWRCSPPPAGRRRASSEVRGLAWRRPWLAGAFTLALLSLAGLPLTAGFVGKIWLLGAGAAGRLWRWPPSWWSTAPSACTTTCGWLRRCLPPGCSPPHRSPRAAPAAPLRVAVPAGLALAVLAALLVALGVYPAPLVGLVRAALAGTP